MCTIAFSLLINAVILLLNCLVLILYLYIHFVSLRCYFFLLKHHLDLNITDTALKVSRSLYCFTTSISHGVENHIPRLWGTGISDAIFLFLLVSDMRLVILDNYDKASVWAARYVKKRIHDFNPGPNKYFTLGLPTGQ